MAAQIGPRLRGMEINIMTVAAGVFIMSVGAASASGLHDEAVDLDAIGSTDVKLITGVTETLGSPFQKRA